ncbi:hypothetical protein ABW20_dc0104614 [Dactylellina cionopaga]|nr:hypothetical protein ABW20_dc0104614 [Dactylellina cionopaga]
MMTSDDIWLAFNKSDTYAFHAHDTPEVCVFDHQNYLSQEGPEDMKAPGTPSAVFEERMMMWDDSMIMQTSQERKVGTRHGNFHQASDNQ